MEHVRAANLAAGLGEDDVVAEVREDGPDICGSCGARQAPGYTIRAGSPCWYCGGSPTTAAMLDDPEF